MTEFQEYIEDCVFPTIREDPNPRFEVEALDYLHKAIDNEWRNFERLVESSNKAKSKTQVSSMGDKRARATHREALLSEVKVWGAFRYVPPNPRVVYSPIKAYKNWQSFGSLKRSDLAEPLERLLACLEELVPGYVGMESDDEALSDSIEKISTKKLAVGKLMSFGSNILGGYGSEYLIGGTGPAKDYFGSEDSLEEATKYLRRAAETALENLPEATVGSTPYGRMAPEKALVIECGRIFARYCPWSLTTTEGHPFWNFVQCQFMAVNWHTSFERRLKDFIKEDKAKILEKLFSDLDFERHYGREDIELSNLIFGLNEKITELSESQIDHLERCKAAKDRLDRRRSLRVVDNITH